MRVAVLGAGGLIGGHLSDRLYREGHDVATVDIKPANEWFQTNLGTQLYAGVDLSHYDNAYHVLSQGFDRVYLLAANMGGIGFIEHHPEECIYSVDISSAVLKAARDTDVGRLFYSSSACAYPIDVQQGHRTVNLREDQAWTGRAEYGYGEEKLFTESLCEFTNLDTRIARYHNIYGTHTNYDGGREKAPAAICRKVAEAVVSGVHEIEIWGDGDQRRSFCYIDDCVEGTIRIMESDYNKPLNLGSDRDVSINELVSIVEEIAGVKLHRNYILTAPTGVMSRNSDNTLIKSILDWAPDTALEDGMERLYRWIYNRLAT